MTVKNVEKLEKSRVAVTVEVGAEEFEAAVAKAYAKARGYQVAQSNGKPELLAHIEELDAEAASTE